MFVKTIVHAFICFHIDYCNSLLADLPKLRFTPLQSVLGSSHVFYPHV